MPHDPTRLPAGPQSASLLRILARAAIAHVRTREIDPATLTEAERWADYEAVVELIRRRGARWVLTVALNVADENGEAV